MITYEQIQQADPYNTAYFYLVKKYGVTHRGFTWGFSEKLRKCATLKKRNEMELAATDNEKNFVLNPVTDDNDKMILLLMHQFNLGIQAKKDLYNVLISENILVV